MSKKKTIPIHPLLFSIYPILYLYSKNIVYLEFTDTLRSIGISLGFSLFIGISLGIILKDSLKSGLLTSLIVIQFFTYGHIANGAEDWLHKLNINFSLYWLSLAWLVVFMIISYRIIRLQHSENASRILNAVGVAAVCFPLISIAISSLSTTQVTAADLQLLAERRGDVLGGSNWTPPSDLEYPDIYYIVFDGYARDDVLSTHYSYDNIQFREELERRGFYPILESRSNYMNTNYSLNTSLNMLYVHEFPKSIFLNSKYNLRTNYVSDFLRRLGYRIVVFDSGSNDTNAQYADEFISPDSLRKQNPADINAFEILLIRSTMGVVLLERGHSSQNTAQASDVFTESVNKELAIRRERIESAFSHLPDYSADTKPHFLFAHIYLPHIPFLYGPEGEPLRYHQDLNLYWYEVEPENYAEVYTHQLDVLNSMTLETIDSILAGSTDPIVIILQSDHGDELFLDYDQPDELGVHVRSAIFNTIYYSDQNYEAFYQSLTPVNTFRLIFNHWFGTQYSLLPDRVFFHEHSLSTARNEIPEFQDACTRFDICLPAPPAIK